MRKQRRETRLRWEKSREKGSGKRERRISELKTEKTVEVEKGWLKGLGRVEILSASRVVARTRIYIYTHTYIHECASGKDALELKVNRRRGGSIGGNRSDDKSISRSRCSERELIR